MASILQQSDLLCPLVNENQIAASPSIVFHHREKALARALTVCKNLSNTATTIILLCYIGCVALSKDYYRDFKN